jgi:hypothetical protein
MFDDPWLQASSDEAIQLSLFRSYLANLESFLETEAKRLSEDLEAHRRGVELSEGPLKNAAEEQRYYQESWHWYQLDLHAGFSNVMRKSFFVTVYGFLETSLLHLCQSQKDKREDILVSPSDITGRGIQKAKTYLQKVLLSDFPFDTSPEWYEIQEYARLRNCIVHNDGRLEGFGHEVLLRRYIDRKETLNLSWGQISLAKDFCKEVLGTVEAFLGELLLPYYS